MLMRILSILFLTASLLYSMDPVGFQGALWGDSPQEVQSKATITGWEQVEPSGLFPDTKDITAYKIAQEIASYKANTYFYFYKDQFFQATIKFDFDSLKTYDFNYNVFISVDKYYREIRNTSRLFVNDIYTLLKEKYGKKQPRFKGIAPHDIFKRTDNYIAQERWNLRYNPSEYYKRIISRGYALWLYPKTEIIFAINISAADKRFDYTLSFTSISLVKEIQAEIQKNRTGKL